MRKFQFPKYQSLDSGQYVKRDIKKAIFYYELAANQNNSQAQYNLGAIYYEMNKINKQYINKAIHYYSLAAKQDDPRSQFRLGVIYLMNKDDNLSRKI